jgi:hypothetical protein
MTEQVIVTDSRNHHGEIVPTLHCPCLSDDPISTDDIVRGYHGCGRLIELRVGAASFGLGLR